jgi:hypothetical protein
VTTRPSRLTLPGSAPDRLNDATSRPRPDASQAAPADLLALTMPPIDGG